jgi:nitrogen fixation NifU-like protein
VIERDTSLDALYREVILDHNRSPRNRRRLGQVTTAQRATNPLCGDEVEVELRIESDRIVELGFQGQGCAISQASASMMTEALTGSSLDEAVETVEAFKRMLTGDGADDEAQPGDLAALAGVRQFPARVKCATLAWHALEEALGQIEQPVIRDPKRLSRLLSVRRTEPGDARAPR